MSSSSSVLYKVPSKKKVGHFAIECSPEKALICNVKNKGKRVYIMKYICKEILVNET